MTSGERIARRAASLERHLKRVAELLPSSVDELEPMTEASDGIILHLWQAVQTCVDLAVSECAMRRLGPPDDYATAFRLLAEEGVVDEALAERLVQAVGFRNLVAHAYDHLDLGLVWEAAVRGPDDLRAFVRALAANPAK